MLRAAQLAITEPGRSFAGGPGNCQAHERKGGPSARCLWNRAFGGVKPRLAVGAQLALR